MKYSVIIPVYNRPDEVSELLASIAAQHFRDFEVLVVEDGSSVKYGEEGEIAVSGVGVTDGYINDPDSVSKIVFHVEIAPDSGGTISVTNPEAPIFTP